MSIKIAFGYYEKATQYHDKQGNELVPFHRREDGQYDCCVITPAIREIPIVCNSDHVVRSGDELTEIY